ncbi:MAG TPA: prepilin peptidase [Longimicrobiales bacterium]|nr:prepilin peptidase [Longimicrobiales bacterium]
MAPDWLLLLWAGIIGAAVGSFLNVCIYRWPAEQSVISPPSRCPGCETQLRWRDNVPILGWLMLRGRCRYCGVSISAQYPLIELATALIWMAAVARFGLELEAMRSAVFLTILLGIAMTDAQHMVIPDQFTLVGAGIGLVLAPAPGGIGLTTALVGAVVGYVLLWLVKLAAEKALRKPALGIGDIHMMVFVGAFTGLSGMLLTLMLGSFLGLLIGAPLAALRRDGPVMGTYLPLGVFLAMGAAIAHVWGAAIMEWYLRYVGIAP